MEDTLNNGYELSDEQAEVLERIQEKVKESVADFDGELEIDWEREQEMGQTI